MLWTTDFPISGWGFRYTLGEVKEVIEEARQCNWDAMMAELCDVYTGFFCAITAHTGLPMPLFWERSAKEYARRISVWEDIFAQHELLFDAKYLINGSNYNREEKLLSVLKEAYKEQKGIDYDGWHYETRPTTD